MADTDQASGAPSDHGQGPQAGGSRSRKRLVAVGLLVLIAVAIAGVLWFRPFSSGGEDAADVQGEATAADVSVDGEPLPAFDDVDDDPAIGMPAPALAGTGLDGGELAITPDDGTPRALLFVAHWCEECQEQMSTVQQALADDALAEPVRVVAVSTGVREEDANYPPGQWFREQGWGVPTLVDSEEGNAAAVYGLRAYPYWVFTTGGGTVVGRLDDVLTVEGLSTLTEELVAAQQEAAPASP